MSESTAGGTPEIDPGAGRASQQRGLVAMASRTPEERQELQAKSRVSMRAKRDADARAARAAAVEVLAAAPKSEQPLPLRKARRKVVHAKRGPKPKDSGDPLSVSSLEQLSDKIVRRQARLILLGGEHFLPKSAKECTAMAAIWHRIGMQRRGGPPPAADPETAHTTDAVEEANEELLRAANRFREIALANKARREAADEQAELDDLEDDS